MRKIKITKEEQAVENSIHEMVPVSQKAFEAIVQSIEARKKEAVLNIRINKNDLAHLKQKASKLGVKYQTFISEVLHQVAEA